MRAVGLFLLFAASAWTGERKEAKKAVPIGPSNGIRTPGVQIPFGSVQPELVYDLQSTGAWIAFTDAIWTVDKDAILRLDPRSKENKLGDPVATVKRPCAGLASGFNSLWVPSCGDGNIARVDARSRKVTAIIASGAGAARQGIA